MASVVAIEDRAGSKKQFARTVDMSIGTSSKTTLSGNLAFEYLSIFLSFGLSSGSVFLLRIFSVDSAGVIKSTRAQLSHSWTCGLRRLGSEKCLPVFHR